MVIPFKNSARIMAHQFASEQNDRSFI